MSLEMKQETVENSSNNDNYINFDRYESSSRERSRKRSRRDRSSSSTRSRSRDSYKRRRYYGTREHPDRSKILGVFGLSSRTIEDDLADIFSHYGPIEDVRIIYDAKSRNSRGFGFIYFKYLDDASIARRECNGMKLDGKRIRVDYSITKRPHTPTPGIYMGPRRSSPSYGRSKHRSRSSYYSRYDSHRRSRSYSR